MNVRVLFFSVLRDVAGTSELPTEVAGGATVNDLLNDLFLRWPKLGDWGKSMLIAVDQTYARRDTVLHEGAEIAIMPPVQGG